MMAVEVYEAVCSLAINVRNVAKVMQNFDRLSKNVCSFYDEIKVLTEKREYFTFSNVKWGAICWFYFKDDIQTVNVNNNKKTE